MVRNCPICNVGLNISYVEDVEIDTCPNCNGVYLDHGEIKKITANSRLHQHFMNTLGSAMISPLLCPGCGASMRLQYLNDTEIDTCGTCKGIWLDPGELQRLASVPPSSIPVPGSPPDYNPKKRSLEDQADDMERKRSKKGEKPDGFFGKLVSVFKQE